MRHRHAIAAACVAIAAGCAPFPQGTDEIYARVERGMTMDEVRRITGHPHETMPFPRLGQDSWGFYYIDTFGYSALFSVTFGPDGRVASKFSRRLNDGGDHQ